MGRNSILQNTDKFDIEQLKHTKVSELYQVEIKNRFQVLEEYPEMNEEMNKNNNDDLNTSNQWNYVKNIIKASTEK